jgi:hypothetical protein
VGPDHIVGATNIVAFAFHSHSITKPDGKRFRQAGSAGGAPLQLQPVSAGN